MNLSGWSAILSVFLLGVDSASEIPGINLTSCYYKSAEAVNPGEMKECQFGGCVARLFNSGKSLELGCQEPGDCTQSRKDIYCCTPKGCNKYENAKKLLSYDSSVHDDPKKTFFCYEYQEWLARGYTFDNYAVHVHQPWKSPILSRCDSKAKGCFFRAKMVTQPYMYLKVESGCGKLSCGATDQFTYCCESNYCNHPFKKYARGKP